MPPPLPEGLARAVRLPDGSTVTWTHTAAGKVKTVTDGRGTTANAYDVRGRLIQVVYPDGRVLRL